jgi:hypothetical protein
VAFNIFAFKDTTINLLNSKNYFRLI